MAKEADLPLPVHHAPGTPALRPNKSTPARSALKVKRNNYQEATPSSSAVTPIRLINRKRPASSSTATPGSATATSKTSIVDFATVNKSPAAVAKAVPVMSEESTITLDSIVKDYLSGQHSLCKNPMSTCPEFDLLKPHKCPDSRPKNSVAGNFLSRMTARAAGMRSYGRAGERLDKRLIYSRFRPVRVFRGGADSGSNSENYFTACALMPDPSEYVVVGTYMGDVKLFDINTQQEVSTYSCHDSQITHLLPNREGTVILTSSKWREPYSCLWSMGEFFESKLEFK